MDVDDGLYTYTDKNGEKHQVPIQRVSSLFQLQKGDHIALPRLRRAYWHHAIVEDIDTKKDEINVIEYSNTDTKGFSEDNSSLLKNPGKAKVTRGKYKAESGEVYLIEHRQSLHADDTIGHARNRLDERKYNVFTKNCEHFALECKTGSSSSEQGDKARMVLKYIVSVLARIVES